MDLIIFDYNQDQRSEFPMKKLFGITEYKNNKIFVHTFDYLLRVNSI